MTADHLIVMTPATAYRTEHYGITHTSDYVYLNPRAGNFPTRVVVWDNTRRVNPDPGGPVQFGQYGPLPTGGDGKYIDPSNRATDDELTILLTPESVTIDAYGTGTGTRGSGQLWAPDGEILRDGDTVRLIFVDPVGEPRVSDYVARIPHNANGHGYLTPA